MQLGNLVTFGFKIENKDFSSSKRLEFNPRSGGKQGVGLCLRFQWWDRPSLLLRPTWVPRQEAEWQRVPQLGRRDR